MDLLLESLWPTINAHAVKSREQRFLSSELVDELDDAGLFGSQSPRELGGAELGPVAATRAFAALAAIDAGVAWCVAVASTGAAVLGARMSDRGAATVFADGVPRVAGSFAPTGTATVVDGGYRVSGRWSFASGIHHAEWVTGGCMDGDGAFITVVIPADAVTIIDNWHVAGLESTGSCDWEVDDQFVSADMVTRVTDPPRRGGSVFQRTLFAFIAPAHAGVALGCAQRALHELNSRAAAKMRLFSAGALGSRETFQRDLGEATLALGAATLLVEDALRDERVDESRIRAATTYATRVALDTCTFAFRCLGAHAIFDGDAVQQCYRDMSVIAQHVYVADSSLVDFGVATLAAAP